jgi:hypothetical protein
VRAYPGLILEREVPDSRLAGFGPGGFQISVVDIGVTNTFKDNSVGTRDRNKGENPEYSQ